MLGPVEELSLRRRRSHRVFHALELAGTGAPQQGIADGDIDCEVGSITQVMDPARFQRGDE